MVAPTPPEAVDSSRMASLCVRESEARIVSMSSGCFGLYGGLVVCVLNVDSAMWWMFARCRRCVRPYLEGAELDEVDVSLRVTLLLAPIRWYGCEQ